MDASLRATTLISTDDLALHLESPDWVVVDCRFDLADQPAGERLYRDAHIPGAVYAHLGRDLAGAKTADQNGRHPLPDPDVLKHTLGSWGISDGVQVVAYDQDTGMFASRLWWLLRFMGHTAVAVLDGGFRAWTREGRTVGSGSEHRTPRVFAGRPDHTAWLKVGDVERVVGTDGSGIQLVDSRAPERYQGLGETIDPVAGHIPGAANYFYKNNVTPEGTFREPEELKAQFTGVLGSTPPDRVVFYCGSGVSACHNLLALEHAGMPGARLYVGSWSEWCRDPKHPIERGERQGD